MNPQDYLIIFCGLNDASLLTQLFISLSIMCIQLFLFYLLQVRQLSAHEGLDERPRRHCGAPSVSRH
jgi:hypothetical protein